MRILIADDSTISRRLLEAALLKWDYDVIVASDGAEAWEELQKDDAPRLAILDWMMPGMSGPEVCRLIREREDERYTYILLVTSRSHREDLIEGMEAGADDYITKPFDQNELKVRLGPGRRIVELQDALLAAQAALREQATIDPLTRIWNRRTTLEILDRELARCARGANPLGLVLADLDRFKSVNDTYGHLAGDRVLHDAARRMASSSRQYDAIGRYGGEEFLFILPGCDDLAAECQAERLRLIIAEAPFEINNGKHLDITCSFGVTAIPPGQNLSQEEIIAIADSALYEAKKRGRNCVVMLDPKVQSQEASG
jgi:diguanylate cyclase (GGDEF)-like protein